MKDFRIILYFIIFGDAAGNILEKFKLRAQGCRGVVLAVKFEFSGGGELIGGFVIKNGDLCDVACFRGRIDVSF